MPAFSELGALRAVKIAHTVIWAFFAASICAIPIFSFMRQHTLAFIFIGIVSIEVVILVANGMRCPLTAIAARYTDERRDNFDIYLPEWLARYNKAVFGPLYIADILVTLGMWIAERL